MTIFILLLITLFFFCTQSFFICHVVLPMVSYFEMGHVYAKRVDFSPSRGTISVVGGRYLAKDNTLEATVDRLLIECQFLSFFTDTPHLNNVQITTPKVRLYQKKSKEAMSLDYPFFTIPNIQIDSFKVVNGTIKSNTFDIKNVMIDLEDLKRGSNFSTRLKGVLNDQFKFDFDNQISVDSKGDIFAGHYALTLLHQQGVFENKGEIKKSNEGLFFDSESACVLTLEAISDQSIIGKSHQRLRYDAHREMIFVEKFEGELALGDQNLLHLHADTQLCFDLKASRFMRHKQLDLVTLEFKKTPLVIFNYLFSLFKVDHDLYFTQGDVCGKLSLCFTDQNRFVFEGPLMFEHCQNQSKKLYNIDDGQLEFFFHSWVDFEGNLQMDVSHLKLQNFGKADGITGGFSTTLNGAQNKIHFEFNLGVKVFPILYDFFPPAQVALAQTFLGDSDFSQTYLNSSSVICYDYSTQKVDSFKAVFDANVRGDSLLKIQIQSTDMPLVYDFDLISYPSIHHPALKSVSIPQDYQNNCAQLLEERYIHLQNRWFLDFHSNIYELQTGVINFYPETDTRRQDVYMTIDSKMTIDSTGISPLFFSLQGHAPALDCSGMIPIEAEAARIFCNYFFTEEDIVYFDGQFEYYFPNNLLKMYDIYFEYPKQDGAYFKISLDTPLENLCGTDTPATDIVIRAKACTRATNFNPALKVIEPYELCDGMITFDNLFTFSFIDDYFSIEGKNQGFDVIFTDGKNKCEKFDFTHKMTTYLTDTHLLINTQQLHISTDSKPRFDAQYKVNLNRFNQKVKSFASWTYLDQWIVNEFDELYLHKIKPLYSMQSQGFCEVNLNEAGAVDHLLCDLICDSVVLENHTQEPLTLMTKFNYAYADSSFTLDSCYFVVQTGDTRKELIHFTGTCTNQSDSSLFFNLHSKYIHLPTFIEFFEEAKSLEQTPESSLDTTDSFTLPKIPFDANIQLDSVVISEGFAVKMSSQVHSTPNALKVENIHILSEPNELFLSLDVTRDSSGVLHQKLHGHSEQLNLYKLAYFTIHYTDEHLEGHLNNLKIDLESYGNTPDSILNHLEGRGSTDLNYIVIPLETESLVLKMTTLPLYLCAQMNQISMPQMGKRVSLTDPFVKIASFRRGRVDLQIADRRIYLKDFSLSDGREIYNFKLIGNIQLEDGKLNDCVAIVKPIPISILAFQVQNSVFDPEVSLTGTMGKTFLEGVRFYANPLEVTSGLGALGSGFVPVYISEKINSVKFWKRDSMRVDEPQKQENNNRSDSELKILRLFNLF